MSIKAQVYSQLVYYIKMFAQTFTYRSFKTQNEENDIMFIFNCFLKNAVNVLASAHLIPLGKDKLT